MQSWEIFKYDQANAFPKEIKCLENNCKKLPKNSCLRSLNPFLIDGVLRVGGRLHFSDVSYVVKHPIIFSKYSSALSAFLLFVHKKVGHLGRESMLSFIREKYFLIKANSLVRKIIKSCIICRKVQGKNLSQQMSDLPSARIVGDTPAFTHVGVDYFVLFSVINGRQAEKRYGVIFTCMSSRAIHLEMSYSLSTDSFINALRRFVSRRGNVKSITSDNGTNFAGSIRELGESIEAWNLKFIKDFLLQQSIQWNFNPPYASHFGGLFEREIRL